MGGGVWGGGERGSHQEACFESGGKKDAISRKKGPDVQGKKGIEGGQRDLLDFVGEVKKRTRKKG